MLYRGVMGKENLDCGCGRESAYDTVCILPSTKFDCRPIVIILLSARISKPILSSKGRSSLRVHYFTIIGNSCVLFPKNIHVTSKLIFHVNLIVSNISKPLSTRRRQ